MRGIFRHEVEPAGNLENGRELRFRALVDCDRIELRSGKPATASVGEPRSYTDAIPSHPASDSRVETGQRGFLDRLLRTHRSRDQGPNPSGPDDADLGVQRTFSGADYRGAQRALHFGA